jgi:hypothetical protein
MRATNLQRELIMDKPTNTRRTLTSDELENVGGGLGLAFINLGVLIGEHCGPMPHKQMYPPPPTYCW